MGKLHAIALALGLALGACVTEADIDTPPQPTDGQDDGSDDPGDDRIPIDPADGIDQQPQCANLQGKGDSPCTPP
jgi:hypothetical protein